MLGLDVDLEADLGIDSIKRIEILSEITDRSRHGRPSRWRPNLEMEKLTVIRTLRGIIDYLDDALSDSPPDPDPSGAAAPAIERPGPNGSDGHRLGLGRGPAGPARSWWPWSIAPSRHRPPRLLTEGVVLFTDDGRGIARSMADQLADLGQRTVFLGPPDDSASEPDPALSTPT